MQSSNLIFPPHDLIFKTIHKYIRDRFDLILGMDGAAYFWFLFYFQISLYIMYMRNKWFGFKHILKTACVVIR